MGALDIGLPQMIWMALTGLAMGVAIARFGERKRDNYDWTDVLLSPALSAGLLYWGGFFS